jgi:hypothetical protein
MIKHITDCTIAGIKEAFVDVLIIMICQFVGYVDRAMMGLLI